MMVKRPKRLSHPEPPNPCHNGCECAIEAREMMEERNRGAMDSDGGVSGVRTPLGPP